MLQNINKINKQFSHFPNILDPRLIRTLYCAKQDSPFMFDCTVGRTEVFPHLAVTENIIAQKVKKIGFYLSVYYYYYHSAATANDYLEFFNGDSKMIFPLQLCTSSQLNTTPKFPINSEHFTIAVTVSGSLHHYSWFAIDYIPQEFYKPEILESLKPMIEPSSSEPEQKSSKLPTLGE